MTRMLKFQIDWTFRIIICTSQLCWERRVLFRRCSCVGLCVSMSVGKSSKVLSRNWRNFLQICVTLNSGSDQIWGTSGTGWYLCCKPVRECWFRGL